MSKQLQTGRSPVRNFWPGRAKIADIMTLRQKIIFFGNFLTKSYWALSWVLLLGWPTGQAIAQALTLRQAVQTALNNYGTIRAKTDYVKAARANVKEVRNEYLPDLNLAAEQVYGTANSSFGPLIGYKTPSVSSSGPTLPTQSWKAAFGS